MRSNLADFLGLKLQSLLALTATISNEADLMGIN
jgi:hypothetical protein